MTSSTRSAADCRARPDLTHVRALAAIALYPLSIALRWRGGRRTGGSIGKTGAEVYCPSKRRTRCVTSSIARCGGFMPRIAACASSLKMSAARCAWSKAGSGVRANSHDHLLMIHRLRPNWTTGRVDRLQTIFLHDPDRRIPFHIVTEGTTRRYLTGADIDPESIQPIGDSFWIGDEFGPYLIRADRRGRVTGFWETRLGERLVRSPDHFSLNMPGLPSGRTAFELQRSRGFEGLAATPDGRMLYGLLEGPIWNAAGNESEQQDGRAFLRILEFDVAGTRWTGRSFRYQLEASTNAIGDFAIIDGNRGLIIERDGGEGDPAQACPQGQRAATCFETPARFKRVYVVSFAGVEDDGFVRKLGYVDLMDVADPNRRARQGGRDGRFTFPFVTIENVDRVDATHIIVANDNNLPFSAGRRLDRADDNEFILLRVPELLNAR
jgi:hypothetical protein